jgi:peptidyl-prolyl cis-trans isomerase C
MNRLLLVVAGAIVLGIGTGEYLTTNFSFRRALGDVVRRGELQVLIGRRGIYDTDVERVWQSDLFAAGAEAQDVEPSTATRQKRAALQRLIEQEKVNAAASGQAINSALVTREMDLLRAQFLDEKTWNRSLASARLTRRALQREAETDLRDGNWLEAQIAARIQPNEAEIGRYYDEHHAAFQEPLRLRASHLFLAAPEGYPAEVIAAKRSLIEELSKRLARGESFPDLVAEFSEDEATKRRGGDLGYFASERMLPAVFDAAQKLHPGETSAPVRSRLGFHIIRLTETRPARALTFEEAQPEIEALLAKQKRADAVAATIAALP